MIYSGIFLLIQVGIIYAYFKFARLEGKKKIYAFALGYPLLNAILITSLLMIFHSKYKSEFSDPPPFITYEIPKEVQAQKGKSYLRSKDTLANIKTLGNKKVFNEFDLEINVNRSQDFIVDDIYTGRLFTRWEREAREKAKREKEEAIKAEAEKTLLAEKKAEAEEYDEPLVLPTKDEIKSKIDELTAIEESKPKKVEKPKTSHRPLVSYSLKEMNSIADSLISDPLANEMAFFACIPNVKKSKTYDQICKNNDYEAYLAAAGQLLIYYTLKGNGFKKFKELVEKVSAVLKMQDDLAGTDVGASYQDAFFKYKLKFFNISKILVSHHKVKKNFRKPLRKAVKKLFPRDKEGNKKRWRYVNVIFDNFVRAKKIELLEQMKQPFLDLENYSLGSPMIPVLRYLNFTGTLGYLLNTTYHKEVREKYMETVFFFIKRRTQFTKVDIEFESRRAVRFERNTLGEILKIHFQKNKSLLNFYGKFLFFDFMRTRGFQEFKRVWEIEYFLEEAVDFVID